MSYCFQRACTNSCISKLSLVDNILSSGFQNTYLAMSVKFRFIIANAKKHKEIKWESAKTSNNRVCPHNVYLGIEISEIVYNLWIAYYKNKIINFTLKVSEMTN